MAWPTIVTDGIVIGNLEFLKDYWTWSASNDRKYSIGAARIVKAEDVGDWIKYDIEATGLVASLTIKSALRPLANRILGFAEEDPGTGREVKAWYLENRLVGISRK